MDVYLENIALDTGNALTDEEDGKESDTTESTSSHSAEIPPKLSITVPNC